MRPVGSNEPPRQVRKVTAATANAATATGQNVEKNRIGKEAGESKWAVGLNSEGGGDSACPLSVSVRGGFA